MKNIVLDFGGCLVYLSGKHYRYEVRVPSNQVAIECLSSGKKWTYPLKGFAIGKREIRFLVKKEEVPQMRLLPKQVKTHAD